MSFLCWPVPSAIVGHRLHRLCGHHPGLSMLLLHLQKMDIQEEKQKEGQRQGQECHQYERRQGRSQNRGNEFNCCCCESTTIQCLLSCCLTKVFLFVIQSYVIADVINHIFCSGTMSQYVFWQPVLYSYQRDTQVLSCYDIQPRSIEFKLILLDGALMEVVKLTSDWRVFQSLFLSPFRSCACFLCHTRTCSLIEECE